MIRAKVLLVEDDAMARELEAEVLGSAEYAVTSAPDGETAISLLEESSMSGVPYEVVVTDIHMPMLNGIDVLQAARSQPQPPAVILLTGRGSLDTALAGLRGGVSDYLLKPVAPDQLRTSVAEAIERRRAELYPSEVLYTIAHGLTRLREIAVGDTDIDTAPVPPQHVQIQVGPLTLNTEFHTAYWQNQPLHVTPIEYVLLRCLAEVPGRVQSYQEIVHHTHDLTLSNRDAKLLLKSHVRNLRRKLGSGYLVNVDGAGYMLALP